MRTPAPQRSRAGFSVLAPLMPQGQMMRGWEGPLRAAQGARQRAGLLSPAVSCASSFENHKHQTCQSVCG